VAQESLFVFLAMIYRIDVSLKDLTNLSSLCREAQDLGLDKGFEVYSRRVYFIEADLSQEDIDRIAQALLIDPPLEKYTIISGMFGAAPSDDEITITCNPGVCDPVTASLEKAIGDLGFRVTNVRTARYYCFDGLSRDHIVYLAKKLIYNPLIEHILEYGKVKDMVTLDEFVNVSYSFKLIEVDILKASDKELDEISQKGCLSLNTEEMRIIKDYFVGLGRRPTDCELETIAQTWSEHCAHKTFRGRIEYEERDESGDQVHREVIDNLLKSTVMKATDEIASAACVSVFHDNSGIVKFNERYNACFKVETHNHPSSLEPYGGASTGIGGVIRDVLGTGCGAYPVASTDIFCFSPWNISHGQVPEGLLHPKRIIKGVVGGVRDYGNKMGIPTVSGAVLFDERFLGNPLVYCGNIGLIPKEKSHKVVNKGDIIIVCGAKTGRDGIHGATFSSTEISEDTVGLTSAVQIGNPIEEKKLAAALTRARDNDCFSAITDCGAGGLSSAVGELAAEHGACVHLDRVPLKYHGLSYTEIWISESQERMVIFTQREHLDALAAIFEEEEVEYALIGDVTDDKKLTLLYEGTQVCQLDMDFLHTLPKLTKQATWIVKKESDEKLKEKASYNQELKTVVASPNIASKE